MQLARVLVVALEILIVADVIETITIDATFESLATIGILVLARTWLGWSLDVETEGCWPWQAARKEKM